MFTNVGNEGISQCSTIRLSVAVLHICFYVFLDYVLLSLFCLALVSLLSFVWPIFSVIQITEAV